MANLVFDPEKLNTPSARAMAEEITKSLRIIRAEKERLLEDARTRGLRPHEEDMLRRLNTRKRELIDKAWQAGLLKRLEPVTQPEGEK